MNAELDTGPRQIATSSHLAALNALRGVRCIVDLHKRMQTIMSHSSESAPLPPLHICLVRDKDRLTVDVICSDALLLQDTRLRVSDCLGRVFVSDPASILNGGIARARSQFTIERDVNLEGALLSLGD